MIIGLLGLIVLISVIMYAYHKLKGG